MGTVTVLHVRSSVYPGGPETTLLGWLKYADAPRFRHHLMFFDERRGLHERSLALFGEHGHPVELMPWAPSKKLVGAVRCILARIRASGGTCVLHSHDVRADFVALVAARIAKVPLVVSNHAWHAQGLKRTIQEGLRARWLPHVDLVINVSEDTHQETMRRGVPPERSVALYSGLDLAPYRSLPKREQMRERLGIPADAPMVCNVARMWPEKAIDVLVQAAARLKPKYPTLQVLQVGDGLLMDDLKALVKQLGLEQCVRLLGFRTDYPDVMRAADVFALPSLAEGMPMVIYSAMALGLPIVASDVNGMHDTLTNETTALIMRPGNVDDLVSSLDRLLADPERAWQMGERARAVMEKRFSAEQTVRQLEALYLRVIDKQTTALPRQQEA